MKIPISSLPKKTTTRIYIGIVAQKEQSTCNIMKTGWEGLRRQMAEGGRALVLQQTPILFPAAI